MERSQFYYINSANRISGTPENFQLELRIPPDAGFDRIALHTCSIPKSYYLIDSSVGNDKFNLDENGTVTEITIPEGNYSYISLAQVLKNELNTQSALGWTYNVTYDNALITGFRGLFTYTVTGNGGIQPKFIFTDTLYQEMGFEPASTNTFSADSLTSTRVIRLQLIDSIVIETDLVKNYQDQILQVIPVNTTDFGLIGFLNNDIGASSKPLASQTTQTFIYDFKLKDQNGDPIDLNGLDFSMTIVLFKKSRMEDLLRAFVRLMAEES